jgi:hypothetical protein
VLIIVVGGLLIGLVLNAQDILETAKRQEAGWQRTVGVGVMEPLAAVTRFLQLDIPRNLLDSALGRRTSTAAAAGPEVSTTSSTVSGTTTTTAVAGRREVTAADPLRLFVGGDSMVGQFGPMLEREAEDSNLVEAEVLYEFESGMTRTDFIDWPDRLRDIRATQDPDVLVLFFGGNDAQDIMIDGAWEPFGTDAWKTEYRRRVGELMTELEQDGRWVYWMGMPIVSSDTFRERVEIMNEIYRTEAGKHKTVTFVDTYPVFTGPDGGYSEYLENEDGELLDMRLNDGIHLTTDGGIRLARVTFDLIATDWSLTG